jgi:hypothetical protein
MSGASPWSEEPLDAMPTPEDASAFLDAVEREAAPPAGEPSVERSASGARGTPDGAPVTRRAALKVLGVVSLAAPALASAQPPSGQAPRQPHATPNQPATTPQGGTPPKSAPKRQFFTAAEHRTASMLADDIIPRDARSASATEAGVPAYLDFHLSLPETSEDTRVAVRGGLRWLDTESRKRCGKAYAAATAAERHALLDDIAWGPERAKPEHLQGAAFFARFRDMVASGFFSSQIGWQDLRYVGNVFNPDWQGCPEPALSKLGVSYAVMSSRIPPQRRTTTP